MVNEKLLARFFPNESVSLGLAEPLDRSAVLQVRAPSFRSEMVGWRFTGSTSVTYSLLSATAPTGSSRGSRPAFQAWGGTEPASLRRTRNRRPRGTLARTIPPSPAARHRQRREPRAASFRLYTGG